jgi:hypothetical protein
MMQLVSRPTHVTKQPLVRSVVALEHHHERVYTINLSGKTLCRYA